MNNEKTEHHTSTLQAPGAGPAALRAAMVIPGGLLTGTLAAWVFSCTLSDYRHFPMYFLAPERFSVTDVLPLTIIACVGVMVVLTWLACAMLARKGSFTDRLTADARIFFSLVLSGCVGFSVIFGADFILASLFVLIAAVTPPVALLVYRLSLRISDALPQLRRLSFVILLLMTAGFGAFFAVQIVRQYHAVKLGYHDSGFVAEALSSTLRGRFLWCNSLSFGSYLGDHFSPIILVLLPVYALFPTLETILIAHSIAIGLGAVPVYLFTRKLTGSRFAGLALAGAFLLHPAVQFQTSCFSYGFKAASLGIPLVLWAMYFMTVRRPGWFVFFCVSALACEESLVPVVMALGAYAALARRMRIGWPAAALAAAWWFAATELLMPHFRGGEASVQFRSFYAWMGDSPAAVILYVLRHPREIIKLFLRREVLAFALQMTLPVGLLCFRSPAALAMGAITLTFLVLSSQPAFLSIYFQYKAGLIPVVFFAAAVGLGRPARSAAARALLAPGTDAARPAPTLACLAIVAAAASCYVFGPTPLSYNYVPSLYDTGRYQAVLEIQELIPQDAAVLATERIAAHFTGQDLLHTLGWEPAADYDFVLVDLDDEWAGREEMFAVRNKCLAGGQYAPVYARDAFVLFKKGARTPAALQSLGPYSGDVEDIVKGRAPVEGGDEARIVRLQLARSQVGAERTDLTVVLYWKCLEPIKTDRGFTITVACATPHDVKVFGRTFHPCLGLFPTSMWKPGMVIADRYDFRLPFDPGKGGMRLRFAWEKWQPRNEGRMVEGEGEKADR